MSDNLLAVMLILWIGGSWLTHVAICIKSASWMFLLAGAIFFPVACVHGTGVWLGFF